MSGYWDANGSHLVHPLSEIPLHGTMGSVVESSTAGATPEARTAVPWQALLIAQESATGASHTQYLAYASPSAAEYSHVYNHVYRSTIPRQYRQGVADAFVLDAQGCIENAHIPHEADPFYKSCLGQARINSLLSGPPTAYGPSYTGQVLDSESQLHIEQDTAPATTGNRQIASDASGFARTCFPLQNSSHRAKRRSLISIINSDWWIQNIFEPDERLLLQFMDYDKHEERWKCSFWEAGDPCQRSCKGKDHAKGHVRFHIQHLPYACEPPCPKNGENCDKRYPTPGPLHKHRVPKVECPECGKTMLQGNLQRHQGGACRNLPSFTH